MGTKELKEFCALDEAANELLKFAMQGEAVASGSVHVYNIAPSLFGGLVKSSVGLALLLAIYLANLYAAYEVSVIRARPALQVVGAVNEAAGERGIVVNAARALGLQASHGMLRAGMQADCAVWDLGHPNELAYWFGRNPCRRVVV